MVILFSSFCETDLESSSLSFVEIVMEMTGSYFGPKISSRENEKDVIFKVHKFA